MNTQTSLIAQQVRLQKWAEQIKSCQSRPDNMDVETWCKHNGITKANYYYRLRRVRQECLVLAQNNMPHFVELPSPNISNPVNPCHIEKSKIPESVAILRGSKNISIEILPTASSEFVRTLIGAFADAQ